MSFRLNKTDLFNTARHVSVCVGLVAASSSLVLAGLFSQGLIHLSPVAADSSVDENSEQVASSPLSISHQLGVQKEKVSNVPGVNKSLLQGQRHVANWLAKKYQVSREAVESIVRLAWRVGAEEKLEPTLLLAIVGVESSYNPFAASPGGAKGLMQVIPHIHKDKFEALSTNGKWSPLNPEMNLRVGAQIMREYENRTGSIQEALRWYTGAAVHGNDGGYPSKVLALKARLDSRFKEGTSLSKKLDQPRI